VFAADVLFETVERIKMTDFVVAMLFTQRREEILNAFVRAGRPSWHLTIEFIIEIAKVTTDDTLLKQFLSTIEFNIEWQQQIFTICFVRGFI
jgi:glycogen debranching enzyme